MKSQAEIQSMLDNLQTYALVDESNWRLQLIIKLLQWVLL